MTTNIAWRHLTILGNLFSNLSRKLLDQHGRDPIEIVIYVKMNSLKVRLSLSLSLCIAETFQRNGARFAIISGVYSVAGTRARMKNRI